jgi:hypothetical protein
MRKADIAAGVVYALEMAGGRFRPVMFLHNGGGELYAQTGGSQGPVGELTAGERADIARRASWPDSSGRRYGYLAVSCGDGLTVTDALRAALGRALAEVSASEELERFLQAEERPSAPYSCYQVITSLKRVNETWAQRMRSKELADKAAREQREREQTLRTRASGVRRAFERKAGIQATWDERNHELRVTLEDAEVLAKLLPVWEGA